MNGSRVDGGSTDGVWGDDGIGRAHAGTLDSLYVLVESIGII